MTLQSLLLALALTTTMTLLFMQQFYPLLQWRHHVRQYAQLWQHGQRLIGLIRSDLEQSSEILPAEHACWLFEQHQDSPQRSGFRQRAQQLQIRHGAADCHSGGWQNLLDEQWVELVEFSLQPIAPLRSAGLGLGLAYPRWALTLTLKGQQIATQLSWRRLLLQANAAYRLPRSTATVKPLSFATTEAP